MKVNLTEVNEAAKRVATSPGTTDIQLIAAWVMTETGVKTIRFRLLTAEAKKPTQGTEGSAGWDIYSGEDLTIAPGETAKVSTGLAVELPRGYYLDVRSRSGHAAAGLTVANSPGTIDWDYRGEVIVLLHNGGKAPVRIAEGARIAQFVMGKIVGVNWLETSGDLTTTKRGKGGLGSTGK